MRNYIMKYEINKKSNSPLYVTEEDELKLNYRCKKEEQQGKGKGSCSDSKSNQEEQPSSMNWLKTARQKADDIKKADKESKMDTSERSENIKTLISLSNRYANETIPSAKKFIEQEIERISKILAEKK